MKKLITMITAILFIACNPFGSDVQNIEPNLNISPSVLIDPTMLNGTSQTLDPVIVTLTQQSGNGPVQTSNYTITTNVSWYGSSTTWTYTITADASAKNISHVNFFGFDNCFWDNISSSEGLALQTEPSATGCFTQDTQVIKYIPTNDSEKRSLTFSWTFNSALTVNASAASIYVKAGTQCQSVSIPGPACELLKVNGIVTERYCEDSKTTERPYEGITVTASQGSEVKTTTTDSNGAYSFNNLGGEWVISVSGTDDQKAVIGPGHATASFLVDTRPNGSCAVVAGSFQQLSCTDAQTTTTTKGFEVTIKNGEVVFATSSTDDLGGYSFSNVPNGIYTVTIEGVSKTVEVSNSEGKFDVEKITSDTRPNKSCAVIIGTTKVIECFQQSSLTKVYAGAIATCEHSSCTSDSNGSFKFLNASVATHNVTIDGVTKSINVTAESGVFNVGEFVIDKTNGGVCGTTEVVCSLSQGYWFAKPNAVWPNGTVTLGGKTYSQAEGKAIWNTSNSKGMLNAKAAFTQAAAIKLSNVAPSASVWADVQIIENYLSSINKLTPTTIPSNSKTGPNALAGAAAGRIGNWINNNHCNE